MFVLIAIFGGKTDSLFARAAYVRRSDLDTVGAEYNGCPGFSWTSTTGSDFETSVCEAFCNTS